MKTNEKTIRCNNCYAIYIEDEHESITQCLQCKTDKYLMELGEESKGHTPTPWEVTESGLTLANDKRIGDLNSFIGPNAEFIVRAVNSYQPLIDAVKDIRYAFYVENSSKKLKEAMIKHAEILQNLIKQAEGGK